MSDNPTLVERLRAFHSRIMSEAADRIEALERELAERTRERDESDALIYDQFRDASLPPPHDLPLELWIDRAIARHQKDKP